MPGSIWTNGDRAAADAAASPMPRALPPQPERATAAATRPTAATHTTPAPRRTRHALVGGLAVAGVVAGLALVAGDPTGAGRVGGGETLVWASTGAGGVGRVNVAVGEFDAVLPVAAAALDVAQAAGTVLVVDREHAALASLDPASVALGDAAGLPGPATQIEILPAPDPAPDAPDPASVALLDPRSGSLWRVPADELGAFDADAPPLRRFGVGAGMAPDGSGGVVVVSPREGRAYRLTPGGIEQLGEFAPFRGSATRPVQVAATAGGWAALDPRSGRLHTAAGAVDLSSWGGDLALERSAAVVTADAPPADVLVATDRRLLAVRDGRVAAIPDATADPVPGATAAPDPGPARPVRVGDCVHAAWSGAALSWCGDDAPRVTALDRAEAAASAELVFRVNGAAVVLNAPATGEVWNVAEPGAAAVPWHGGIGEPADPPREEQPPPAAGSADPIAPVLQPQRPGPNAPTVPDAPPQPDAAQGPQPDAPEPEPPAPDPAAPEPDAPPAPLRPGSVRAFTDPAAGAVMVEWSPFTAGAPVRGYFAQRLRPGESPGSCRADGGAVTAPTGGEVLDAGAALAAAFGGAAPPDGGYRLIVWGYTADECVASEAVTVHADPLPAAVAHDGGAMAWIGTRYEYVAAPAAFAGFYQLRAPGAGDAVAFTGSAVPRELLGGSFGQPAAYELRACTPWGSEARCGEWTAFAAPEPSLDFTLAELAYDEATGTWTWSGLPDNGGASVRVSCWSYSQTHGQMVGQPGGCSTTTVVPANDAVLQARIAGVTLLMTGDAW
ncbi:hypothetical protein ACWDR7_06100 [Microbacterium sp. NPDC003461]